MTTVNKSTTSRAVTGLLLLATVACVMVALLNLADRSDFQLPDDGIVWVDRPDGVESLHVALEGAGVAMDRKANAAFYGSARITPEQIFSGSGNAAPQAANTFVQVLTAQTRRLPMRPGMVDDATTKS